MPAILYKMPHNTFQEKPPGPYRSECKEKISIVYGAASKLLRLAHIVNLYLAVLADLSHALADSLHLLDDVLE